MLPPSWSSHPKDVRKWHPAIYNWVLQWSVPSTVLRVTGPSPWSCESESCSVMSDSLPPHGLYSPWNSPGQNTRVGSLSLFHGIIPTQGSNPGLQHWKQILHQLNPKGSPPCNITRDLLLTWQYTPCNSVYKMNLISVISLFGIFYGPSEASQS